MKPQSFEEAVARVPPRLAAMHRQVIARVARLYPQAERVVWYGVPAFALPTGRVGVGHWKDGVSLYPGPRAVAAYVARVPDALAGKGAARLPLGHPLGPDVDRLVRDGMEGL